MNNKNYISEEAFEELVNGLDFIGSFTLYGRKSLKYHIKRLQEENQQLKKQLQQKKNIINKAIEYINLIMLGETLEEKPILFKERAEGQYLLDVLKEVE